ncbi:unnamed protein product [Caenorhabditis sp. 36 PRJEB53466]|nr:unnamed protein product [Caenorhabditis sp. 36 PRJEB53466]
MPRFDTSGQVCNSSIFKTAEENARYVFIAAYSIPGFLMNLRLLWILSVSHKDFYMAQPFFVLFGCDILLSLLRTPLMLLVNHPINYIPQLCGTLADFYNTHAFLIHIFHPLILYLKNAKIAVQIVLSVNRMTCVLAPVKHTIFWQTRLRIVVFAILVYPFFIIWNVIISEKGLVSTFGGFSFEYERAVQWAALSLLTSVSLLVAVLIISLCSFVTVLRMQTLQNRLQKTERHVSVATVWTNFAFFLIAASQVYFLFFYGNVESAWRNFFYFLNDISYDVLDFEGVLVILIVPKLRAHFVGRRVAAARGAVRSMSSSQ